MDSTENMKKFSQKHMFLALKTLRTIMDAWHFKNNHIFIQVDLKIEDQYKNIKHEATITVYSGHNIKYLQIYFVQNF